jgi:hypothetical protein
VRLRILGVAALLALLALSPLAVAQTPAATPAYLQRGAVVEAHYRAYRDRLQRFYDALRRDVARDAPDLLPSVKAAAPPTPLPHGYGVLPALSADAPPPAAPPRATGAWYSWPWTDQKIDRDQHTLDGLQADLARSAQLPAAERRATYERLLAAYRTLIANHRIIDDHIQYNRLWQAEIARDPAGYTYTTRLYHAVLERQAILDALRAADDAAFRAALRGSALADPARPRAVLEPELRAREQALAREIDAATDRVPPPSFMHVRHPAAHRWTLEVPVYTDIEDTHFVRRVAAAVERLWHVRDGGDEFRVRLSIIPIAARRLYSPAPPPREAAIDVGAHCARFPQDGAVLTTGASTTHVLGRCMILGTQTIAPHKLAHEFGHVLGFRDVYFRGYTDLGADGYQVMEVIADPGDIMGDPAAGPVLRHHFDSLVTSRPNSVSDLARRSDATRSGPAEPTPTAGPTAASRRPSSSPGNP